MKCRVKLNIERLDVSKPENSGYQGVPRPPASIEIGALQPCYLNAPKGATITASSLFVANHTAFKELVAPVEDKKEVDQIKDEKVKVDTSIRQGKPLYFAKKEDGSFVAMLEHKPSK